MDLALGERRSDLLRRAVAAAIRAYQRFVSPYKGFRCAYGVLHGDGTCSSRILRAVRERPSREWLPAVRAQFAQCSAAYAVLRVKRREPLTPEEKARRKEARKKQSDGSDCNLAGCDIGSCPADFDCGPCHIDF